MRGGICGRVVCDRKGVWARGDREGVLKEEGKGCVGKGDRWERVEYVRMEDNNKKLERFGDL